MKTVGLSLALIAVLGCASTKPNTAIGVTRDLPPEPEPKHGDAKPPISKLHPEIVERAALPFFGVRASDGARFSSEDLLHQLAKADLICIGENHDDPHHHWAELRVLRGLVARTGTRGRELGIGLEMIQRPYQAVLDKYMSLQIEEQELVDEVEWHERWGYDWAYYRPILELGRRARLPALALNAPRELTQKISREGVDALSDQESKQLPELDLSDSEHRAWFERATKDHPPPAKSRDQMYAAQVLWDETMAETATRWLKGHLPLRQLVVLAGSGHCHDSAIPARVRRRISAKVVSVRPVVQAAEADPAAALVGFDYAFVMTP